MDAKPEMEDSSRKSAAGPAENPPSNEEEANRVVEENRKKSTSGLSWDEVAADDEKGWHQVTEMGEGD
jgi:hypothetical protein